MALKRTFGYGCALALGARAALGFSTHNATLARQAERHEAMTGAAIVVTATLTNSEAHSLRGVYVTDHIPSSLAVTTVSIRIGGGSVAT